MTGNNKKEFISRLKSGDTESFNYFYNTYCKKIHTLAFKMTGSIEDADEITQETFIKAYQNIKKFKGNSQIYTWLYKIAKNICFRFLEKKKRSSFHLLEDLIYSHGENNSYKSGSEPEKQFYIAQVKEGCLNGLLNCLSFHQRIAFILHVLLKVPVKITAEIIQKSGNHTKVLVHRARKNLKKFLCENCSLYNKENPCRCENLINFSLKQGWINEPGKNDLKGPSKDDSALIENEINEIKRITVLYKSLPERKPEKDITKTLQTVFQEKKLTILDK